ncbi:MAG: thiamine phosphate synthase [Acidobacteriota bacterium]|nr:thiamine phosphate synthase [Acidobacteriota bacterium]
MPAFPRLYPILDRNFLSRGLWDLVRVSEALRAAGVELLQYRDKSGGPQEILRAAQLLGDAFAGSACRLMMNDRADLAMLAGWGGVHVGQWDLSPDDARLVVGATRWVGVSTHTEEQVRVAERSCADYVAVGPVFATGTKLDAEPVVGLEGVRRARALTAKPLVAIGGITRNNARNVIDAGADSVAIIGGLFTQGELIEKVAGDFLDVLG